jgi:hypothetical protein
MSKVVEIIVAHCEVCPYSVAAIPMGLRCKFPPNITRDNVKNHIGRKITISELPIPKWCKLPDKEYKKNGN